MRRLILMSLALLSPALAVAAEGYAIDIDPGQSELVITFLGGDHSGAIDGSLYCWTDPGLVDGAEAVVSDVDATVTDIETLFVSLRDIVISSDPGQPGSGHVVDEQPGDGHVALYQTLYLVMDAIYDPRLGSEVPFQTASTLCVGSTGFCGGEPDGSSDVDTDALWFEVVAEGAIPADQNPTGQDIPFQLTVRGQGTPDLTAVPVEDADPALSVWPNPSRDRVAFALETAAPAQVTIFDVAGRRVAALSGAGQLDWDGRDASGRRAGAGVYLARYRAGNAEGAVKVMMLR